MHEDEAAYNELRAYTLGEPMSCSVIRCGIQTPNLRFK